MKLELFRDFRALFGLLTVVLGLATTGCSPFTSTASKPSVSPNQPTVVNVHTNGARLHAGDTITITLKGPPVDIDPMTKLIKDDGTISLPYLDEIQAAGKTPGELENIIHDLYVPKYYTHLDVTVQASNSRVYYVLGEVKRPDRYVYTGEITVSRAIASAGDFTDFADKSEVYLTRANGQRSELNLKKILAGEATDPPVYPGDRIEVARRWY